MNTKRRTEGLSNALLHREEIAGSGSWNVHGIDVPLGLGKRWTRRVVDHMMPDSPVADAPEKIPYRLLSHMTGDQLCSQSFDDVFSGDFAPLRPLFLYQGKKSKAEIPVAFHVLMTLANGKRPVAAKVYSERTFRLLCSDETGTLDADLVRSTIERFRVPLEDLNAIEQSVIGRLSPTFDPARGTPEPGVGGTRPFMPDVAAAFRADLQTLLRVHLSPSEFFRCFTRTLALHFGLYQPRLAKRLNPAMQALRDCTTGQTLVNVDDVIAMERGTHPEHLFAGSYATRAPGASDSVAVARTAPERVAYQRMDRELSRLHFSLIMYGHVRREAERFFSAKFGVDSGLGDLLDHPSSLVAKLAYKPDARGFLDETLAVLAMAAVEELLSGDAEMVARIEREATCGYDALLKTLEAYNRTTGATRWRVRSRKSGVQVTDALLKVREEDDFGLIKKRTGVGSYFEMGSDTVTLLLLLLVGDRDKIRLDHFWQGIENFGLDLSLSDRDVLLGRLKSMGLFERYSDAGEANFVRGLVIAKGTT